MFTYQRSTYCGISFQRKWFKVDIKCRAKKSIDSFCRCLTMVSNNRRMISVVDDDPDISKLFYEVLRENVKDLDVFSFNDPVSALKHFAENESNYALIICDLRMPGLNGLELLKKVKDKNSSVRTILTSGYNFDEDKLFQDYMEKGIIDSNIEKPVTIQRLCQRVRDEIEIYQLQNS
jgi:DNA-binding NtrC family response regulator